MAATKAQLQLDFETPDRRCGAMLCVLERWRFPEATVVLLIRANAEKRQPGSEPALRVKGDGCIRSTGLQHRATSLLKAIHSFGRECFAAVHTIAARMGCSHHTAQRAIADAMLAGTIRVHQGSHHATSHYHIEWPRLFDWTHFPEFLEHASFFVPESGVPPCSSGVPPSNSGVPPRSNRGATVAPKPQVEPPKEPQIKTTTTVGRGFLKCGMAKGDNPWPFEVTREHLTQLHAIRQLLARAIERGWCQPSQSDELRFVTLCLYCHREGQQPSRLLTSNVAAGQWRGTLKDEDQAKLLLSGRGGQAKCPVCQGWGDSCSRCGRGCRPKQPEGPAEAAAGAKGTSPDSLPPTS